MLISKTVLTPKEIFWLLKKTVNELNRRIIAVPTACTQSILIINKK